MKANMNKKMFRKCAALENWKENNKQKYKNRSQDPFWYAEDENAIKNMATLVWNSVVGSKIKGTDQDVIPALLVIPYKRTGCATGSQSATLNNALTRTAETFFQYMAQGFTGNVDFEAADLLMTSMAGSSLLADMVEGKRMFGFLNYFSDLNSYYAKSLIRALGFNYESFTKGDKSKADFVADYNLRVDQINDLIHIPKGFKVDERWNYLASYVFSDNSDPEYNTLFAYKCRGGLEYNPTHMTTGTCLTWSDMYAMESEHNGITYDDFFAHIDSMIDALTGEDQRQIFGALKRVYSDDQFITLSKMDENFTSDIVRNDVVAAAVHNANYFSVVTTDVPSGLVADDDDIEVPVYQTSTGKIICRIGARNVVPNDESTGTAVMLDPRDPQLVDLFGHMLTPGNVLDVTAMKAGFEDWGFSSTRVTPTGAMTDIDGIVVDRFTDVQEITTRSEVFLTPIMWTTDVASESFISKPIILNIEGFNSDYDYTVIPKWFYLLSHFNSHPYVNEVRAGRYDAGWQADPEKYYKINYRIGEIDTYTTVSNDVLSDMHERSAVELFKLPRSTRSVT